MAEVAAVCCSSSFSISMAAARILLGPAASSPGLARTASRAAASPNTLLMAGMEPRSVEAAVVSSEGKWLATLLAVCVSPSTSCSAAHP